MNSSKRSLTTLQFFLGPLFLLLFFVASVESLSPSSKSNNQRQQGTISDRTSSTQAQAPWSRRELFRRASGLTTLVIGATTAPKPSDAACLQGDLRPVCIGIYKVPMDEAILPYVSTPEELHKFAPDLEYVPPIEYPKSFESAMAILRTQRQNADNIKKDVLEGRLEEAGIQVLGLIPQVTASSRRVLADLKAKIRTSGLLASSGNNKNTREEYLDRIPTESETTVEEMAIEMAENQMNCVTGYWGDCDITIGQGIRGELGKVTVAQLTILESLRDATCALDDYLVTATTLGREDASV